jgi:hypothetical protein
LRAKPFDEHIEGLSRYRAKTCAIEGAVQTDDFEDSPLRGVIGRNPLISQGLRVFKHFDGQFRVFVVRAVRHVRLELDRGQPIPQFSVHAGKGLLIDLIRDPQIEQPVLVMIAPVQGASVRVGGTREALVSGSDGNYRAGACSIDTPLPVGYPPPTPPDAIDLKTYPRVRLAEVSGSGYPDAGMNEPFWTLFNHIKRHDIAMTSPV